MMGADICIVYCLLTDCMQQPYYYDYIILSLSLFFSFLPLYSTILLFILFFFVYKTTSKTLLHSLSTLKSPILNPLLSFQHKPNNQYHRFQPLSLTHTHTHLQCKNIKLNSKIVLFSSKCFLVYN